MHLAARGAAVDALKTLAATGADLDSRTTKGNTAAHLAAGTGSVNCLKALVSLRADLTVQNLDGLTPMDLAQNDEVRKCAWYLA